MMNGRAQDSSAEAKSSVAAAPPIMVDLTESQVFQRVFELRNELEAAKRELAAVRSSRSYKLVARVRHSKYGPLLHKAVKVLVPSSDGIARALINRNLQALVRALISPLKRTTKTKQVHVHIEPLRKHHPDSQGNQVWILSVEQAPPFDFHSTRHSPAWEVRPNHATPSGFCLMSDYGDKMQVSVAPNARLLFMTHPWSGQVALRWKRRKISVDLYHPHTGTLEVDLASGQVHGNLPALPVRSAIQGAASASKPSSMFSEAERDWINRMAWSPQPVALIHPEWRGIRSATIQLFDEVFKVPDTLDEQQGQRYARLFVEANCPALVIQGFPHSYRHLVLALQRIAPRMPIYVMWHGSFLQASEDYDWEGFQTVAHFCRSGAIRKWGFVKQGMAEIMAARGFRTGFVMNMMRHIPTEASTPLANGPHFGIWSIYQNWRKPPYGMLAALSMFPDASIHTSGTNTRVEEFGNLLGLRAHMDNQAVEQHQMPQRLAQMDLNLYVTLSECAPMLPIESLSVGVPCLLGPNSHYFEDDPYLYSRLVVAHPDDAHMITRYIRTALEERTAIVDAYRAYAPVYNNRARASLEAFLEMPYPVDRA